MVEENPVNNIRGAGGTLTVNATESVSVLGSATIGSNMENSRLFTQGEGTGNAGDINIFTADLTVEDRGEVNVSATGDGAAGSLTVQTEAIALDNGTLSANTQVGDGGNINLDTANLVLRNESLISTNAQSTDGGNIIINTDTLAALNKSDITANADRGEGGRVTINAQGVFGTEFREALTPESDITATSELGPQFSGEVIINTPEVDPASGLVELPESPIDAEAILANDPCALKNDKIAGGSSFIITGRGGLRPNSDDPVFNTHRTVRWTTRPSLPGSSRRQLQQQPSVTLPQLPQQQTVLIEAQGWVVGPDGTIILTAQPYRGTPVDASFIHPYCKISQQSTAHLETVSRQ